MSSDFYSVVRRSELRLLCFQEPGSGTASHALTLEGQPGLLASPPTSGGRSSEVRRTNKVLRIHTANPTEGGGRPDRNESVYGKNRVGESLLSPPESLFFTFCDLCGQTQPVSAPYPDRSPRTVQGSGLREHRVSSSGNFCSRPLRKMRVKTRQDEDQRFS